MSKRNGPVTRITAALNRVNGEQSSEIRSAGGGLHARGLSSEGYTGGYAAALRDVLLVMRGIKPGSSWGFWDDWTEDDA